MTEESEMAVVRGAVPSPSCFGVSGLLAGGEAAVGGGAEDDLVDCRK